MNWKYYISQTDDPYHNLAVEEALLHSLAPGEVVLYLWQNADTIVIGKNQNAWRECLVEEFENAGGLLARRLSGGGAVYHDMGNQNFTFLAGEESYDVARHMEVIRRAVASFGIEATVSGRNDILAEGRKFSGNAFCQIGPNRYHHGTILIGSDMQRLGAFLRPSKEKLAAKGVPSVRARVVNLAQLNSAITPDAMRCALLAEMETMYGGTGTALEEGRLEAEDLPALRARYASDAWRLHKKQPFTHRLYTRLPFGEVELLLDVQKGAVTNATVHTDAMDPGWAEPLAAHLCGAGGSAQALANAVAQCTDIPPEHRTELANWLVGKNVV